MKKQASERMDKALEFFESELATLRTGRPNPTMLNRIVIDYYGVETPLNQLSQISVVEGRQLVIKPYDKGQLKDIEKALNLADFGVNVQNDGTVVRMLFPPLTEETRKDLAKEVNRMLEEAKVNIRNVRRDINDTIKKDKDLPEDESRRLLDDIQELTDKKIKEAETISQAKISDIMTI